MTRDANNGFFAKEEHMADSEYNLTGPEYLAMFQIAGIATDIIDVEHYVEASNYDTGSIVHPLTMYLCGSFASGTVHVLDYALDYANPTGDRVEVSSSSLCPMAKAVLDAAQSELK